MTPADGGAVIDTLRSAGLASSMMSGCENSSNRTPPAMQKQSTVSGSQLASWNTQALFAAADVAEQLHPARGVAGAFADAAAMVHVDGDGRAGGRTERGDGEQDEHRFHGLHSDPLAGGGHGAKAGRTARAPPAAGPARSF